MPPPMPMLLLVPQHEGMLLLVKKRSVKKRTWGFPTAFRPRGLQLVLSLALESLTKQTTARKLGNVG